MPPAAESLATRRLTLADLPVGAAGRVHSLRGETGVRERLREMGFCESAVVEKISGTGRSTLLCQLAGTRIALSDRIGNDIVVEMIPRAGGIRPGAKHAR
jgi:ferrous iron transport protein A